MSLEQEIAIEPSEDSGVVGWVVGLPECEITVDEVRAAAAEGGCKAVADFLGLDALGTEMVFSCLLEHTGGNPPEGTKVYVSGTAMGRLVAGE